MAKDKNQKKSAQSAQSRNNSKAPTQEETTPATPRPGTPQPRNCR